jgi:16S rRNA (guanine527-N7)-methyltransferase
VREWLKPFAVDLSDHQVEQVIVYLNLLLRWNQKINLTAIRTPEECITRHFGESFLVSRAIPLAGSLLDVGSGAGFPGLALKILHPEITALLLEPTGKKRAFLKEVINTCRLNSVKVSQWTLDELVSQQASEVFDIVTIRAVGSLKRLLTPALETLKLGGHLCLWIGSGQAETISDDELRVEWKAPMEVPNSQKRQILIGSKLYIS